MNSPATRIGCAATSSAMVSIGVMAGADSDTGAWSTAVTGWVFVGVIPPLGVSTASRCGSISSAVWNRSAAFFSRHRITTMFRTSGTAVRCFVTGCASSVTC